MAAARPGKRTKPKLRTTLRKKRLLAAGLVTAGLALALAGCHKDVSPPPAPVPAPAPAPEAALPPAPTETATIYVVNPDAKGNDDALMPRTVKLTHPSAPAGDAVTALIDAPHSPIPEGTSLRGITIVDGLATVDFSRSPVNETGGEGGQGEALTALSRTLGQFPDIRLFQIAVRGKIVKEFGEFTTDGPMDVVRPDAVKSARTPAPEGAP